MKVLNRCWLLAISCISVILIISPVSSAKVTEDPSDIPVTGNQSKVSALTSQAL